MNGKQLVHKNINKAVLNVWLLSYRFVFENMLQISEDEMLFLKEENV